MTTTTPQTFYVAVIVGDVDVPFTQTFDNWTQAYLFAGNLRQTFKLPVKVRVS